VRNWLGVGNAVRQWPKFASVAELRSIMVLVVLKKQSGVMDYSDEGII
jgi:hypothetical protein